MATESVKLQPLGDRVVVKALARETVTKSGIVLPDTAKERPQEGEVLAVGPGKVLDNGKRNSDKLLRMVADKMLAQHPDVKINYYRKLGAYRPAPAALLDQVVAENDRPDVGRARFPPSRRCAYAGK